MSGDLAPFGSNPLDATVEVVRKAMCARFIEIVHQMKQTNLTNHQMFEVMTVGALVGTFGSIMAFTEIEHHAGLKAQLSETFDACWQQAMEIHLANTKAGGSA